MTRTLVFLVYLWNKKVQLLLPTLILPILTLAWSLSYQPYYEAVTTLGLDKRLVSSPLLKNIASPENESILERRLKSHTLLKDTLTDAGIIFDTSKLSKAELSAKTLTFADHIHLNVIDSESLQITYKDAVRANAERVLETLSNNFIDDILAPERLRTEEKLLNLSEQVRYYSEIEKKAKSKLDAKQASLTRASGEAQQNKILKEVVRLEFDVQKAAAQKDLAQADYERLLLESRSLITGARLGQGNIILQYLEPPTLISGDRGTAEHARIFWIGLKIGLLIGILSLLISRMSDTTLRRDKTIYDHFGVKILGRMPNLGEVTMKNGRLIVDPTKMKF